MMDLFAGYDQHPLHWDSQDLTTFSSPMGTHCLTTILMGYTNAVQIYQANISFILQEEIPQFTYPFINDLPVKEVKTWYQNLDGTYKTIPENPKICCFIWEHLLNIYHILQRLKTINVTVSTMKFVLATLDATIVSHKCWILYSIFGITCLLKQYLHRTILTLVLLQ